MINNLVNKNYINNLIEDFTYNKDKLINNVIEIK